MDHITFPSKCGSFARNLEGNDKIPTQSAEVFLKWSDTHIFFHKCQKAAIEVICSKPIVKNTKIMDN
jgi:hypothetical protein